MPVIALIVPTSPHPNKGLANLTKSSPKAPPPVLAPSVSLGPQMVSQLLHNDPLVFWAID